MENILKRKISLSKKIRIIRKKILLKTIRTFWY